MSNIFWIGDSTVKQNTIITYPQTGIGQVFPLFLKKGIILENHAENGSSTKSFLEEARFEVIKERMTEKDFLFIQFGHNDEHVSNPMRYTEPYAAYKDNLKTFVQSALDKKAYPVLITPVERRNFREDGTLEENSHFDYVEAMKQAAGETTVPLIDLCNMSRTELAKAGPDISRPWYMHLQPGEFVSQPDGLEDNTHLQYAGAVVFAACVARGLKELGGIYRELLIEEF